ncbi:MAG: 6,7-dimethyl-8-ribityllumazine synthase [Armatimonadetes bacterium]|nr:6,7-dimethyl-8-ribityllumazine synthase [Armatimonadota bacterium]
MGKGKYRIAVLVSRWNELVTKALLEGALDELRAHGIEDIKVIHVPGTWEMPPVARQLVTAKEKPDAVIALGCILQGATAHAKMLGADVSTALMMLQAEHGVPIAWGVLTPNNLDDAMDRAGMKMGNKGREAALAALEMANVLEQLD